MAHFEIVGGSVMNWNRIISALIALGYLGLAFGLRGAEGAFKMGLFLIFPMFCIWFSDAMGSYRGLTLSMVSVSPSPAILVRILGWVLLLMPIVLGIIIR